MRPTQPKNLMNAVLLMAIVVSSVTIAGCHRGYYRRQADAEVKRLISEKTLDPRWSSVDGNIEIDAQSRMHDPFSQDHPPIPPDDAASHQLMHNVDGKPGYPHWHANGDTAAIENPLWKSYLPMNEQGQVVLSLERAYQLALLHSPDLQQQQETLYQSALNVSVERFGFDSQLFAGYNSFFTTQGRLAAGGSQSNFSNGLGANGQGINLRRAGITGANLAVGLANTILFNFAGNNTQTANSLLDFSIIQPLLRGAGRQRILESLTQSERTLLANVRQLERFKRGFYLQVAMGRNPGAGVRLGGNFLAAPAGGNRAAGGYLGLLEQQQQIRNLEFNVRQLETVLEQFVEFYDAGRLSIVQFKRVESSFYRQQRSLLAAKVQYQTALDSFKLQLGLPPELAVVVDDEFLNQFELISDEVNNRLYEAGNLRKTAGEVLSELDKSISGFAKAKDGIEKDNFEWPDNLEDQLNQIKPSLTAALGLIKSIRTEDIAQVEKDIQRLANNRDSRLEYLESLTTDVAAGRIISNISSDLFDENTIPDPIELEGLLSDPTAAETALESGETPSILSRVKQLQQQVNETQSRIDNFPKASKTLSGQALYDYLNDQFEKAVPSQLADLNNIVLDLSLIQALARSNSIQIINSNISDEQAIRVARCLRRDWMNARASLVDQYRNIEFVADQLEAGIDLVFEGSVGNFGDNPFKIRTETGQLRAGLRFDAPIVRLAERNQYRTALIQYQQAKRSFYQFEDSIKQNLREVVRNLGQNRVQFELDRRSVQVDIEFVESARLELERPKIGNARVNAQTAQNVTDAINQLNNSQNAYLNTWVQYEVLRRNLDFDMGTMQIDPMGQWLDPGIIDDSIGLRACAAMGIEPDCQFCENIGTSYEPDPPASSKLLDQDEDLDQNSDTVEGKLDSNDEITPTKIDTEVDRPESTSPLLEPARPSVRTQPRAKPLEPAPAPEPIRSPVDLPTSESIIPIAKPPSPPSIGPLNGTTNQPSKPLVSATKGQLAKTSFDLAPKLGRLDFALAPSSIKSASRITPSKSELVFHALPPNIGSTPSDSAPKSVDTNLQQAVPVKSLESRIETPMAPVEPAFGGLFDRFQRNSGSKAN